MQANKMLIRIISDHCRSIFVNFWVSVGLFRKILARFGSVLV